jgi:hypothetical protein
MASLSAIRENTPLNNQNTLEGDLNNALSINALLNVKSFHDPINSFDKQVEKNID